MTYRKTTVYDFLICTEWVLKSLVYSRFLKTYKTSYKFFLLKNLKTYCSKVENLEKWLNNIGKLKEKKKNCYTWTYLRAQNVRSK